MVRIPPDALRRFATDVISGFGSPPEIASVVADALVAADLRGHESHGVRRLATLYPGMIDANDLDPAAEATIVTERPDAVHIDGNNGWGHVAGRKAVELGVELVEDQTIGLVGIHNATHMGRIGEFGELAARHGLIFLAFVSTGGTAAMAAAPGSTDRNLAVNPMVLAVPTFDALAFDLVLDISTGQVAHGKIMKQALAREPLPDEWAIAPDGQPMHDAVSFEGGEGAILPFGGRDFGFKGAGMSMLIELITGAAADVDVHGEGVTRGVNNGGVFVFLDPLWICSEAAYRERIAAFAEHVRSIEFDAPQSEATTMHGSHMRLPGAIEHEAALTRRTEGIPFDEQSIDELAAIARAYGANPRPLRSK